MHKGSIFEFFTGSEISKTVIEASYDWSLVLASIITAILASYVAFEACARTKNSGIEGEDKLFTILSAIFLGVGVWSMHFIGMYAYQLPINVTYDPFITMFSVVPAIGASYVVLAPSFSKFIPLLLRAVLMGGGIGCMHYIGMLAMRMSAHMYFEPRLFFLSIFVAVILAGIALKINDMRNSLNKNDKLINAVSALVMGSAISAMHYTGMTSMVVVETDATVFHRSSAENYLAETIFAVIVLVSVISLVTLELRTRLRLAQRLRTVLNAVQEGVLNIDGTGVIKYANPAVTRILGYTRDELEGAQLATLIEEKDVPKFERHLMARKSSGYESKAEHRVILQGKTKDGESTPIMLVVHEGNVTQGLVVTIQDLSDIQNQESFMHTIIDSLPLMLFIKDAQNFRFTHINKSGEKLLGKTEDELLGKSDNDLFAREEAEFFREIDKKVIESGERFVVDEEPITINGEVRYLHTTKVPIFDRFGEPKYLLGVSEDTTEFTKIKKDLEALTKRLSLAADAAKIGVWEWNLNTNELVWDEWMFKIFELDQDSVDGTYQDWAKSLHPEDYEKAVGDLEESIAKGEDFHSQFRIVTPGGEIKHIRADAQISGDKMIGINVDISEVVRAQQHIYKLAQTDNLTGLANRAALSKFVKKEIVRCNRDKKLLGCLYFDLDNFKPVNDTYGHKVGDEVLIKVAERLTKASRELDLVARIGGDEFVVIITSMDSDDQIQFALKRFQSELEAPIEFDKNTTQIETSVGFAIFPNEAKNMDELLSKADERMYQDKNRRKKEESIAKGKK